MEKKKKRKHGVKGSKRGMLKSKRARLAHTPDVEEPSTQPSTPEEPAEYMGYDISMLPREAYPDTSKVNKGHHSYTLRSKQGDATIEVLLKHGAFFVKKISEKGTGPPGHVAMRMFGVEEAWNIAKTRAGFDVK